MKSSNGDLNEELRGKNEANTRAERRILTRKPRVVQRVKNRKPAGQTAINDQSQRSTIKQQRSNHRFPNAGEQR